MYTVYMYISIDGLDLPARREVHLHPGARGRALGALFEGRIKTCNHFHPLQLYTYGLVNNKAYHMRGASPSWPC